MGFRPEPATFCYNLGEKSGLGKKPTGVSTPKVFLYDLVFPDTAGILSSVRPQIIALGDYYGGLNLYYWNRFGVL